MYTFKSKTSLPCVGQPLKIPPELLATEASTNATIWNENALKYNWNLGFAQTH